MIAEALLMATSIWYIPGWMRAKEPERGVIPALTEAFNNSTVEFKTWDGNSTMWPSAVEAADREAWRFAFELATMPKEEREELTIVGHSLGGRILVRVLAILARRGLRIRQGILLAAAIPYEDEDLAKIGAGSKLPVVAICNPDDVTLRYIYAIAGGEKSAAFGANGTLRSIDNVIERVVPKDITSQVEIERRWAKTQVLKDIANHHALFYIAYLKEVLAGEEAIEDVMVVQHLPTIEHKVVDAGIWWRVVAETNGWKLEKHRLTKHCRILSPEKICRAWGSEAKMRASFEKVEQLYSTKQEE